MKPWKTILMYLFNFLIGVCLYYSYYFIFEKVYTYEIVFSYKAPIIESSKLSGYWQPLSIYNIKGMGKCNELMGIKEKEYGLKVKSCKRVDMRVYWQKFRE